MQGALSQVGRSPQRTPCRARVVIPCALAVLACFCFGGGAHAATAAAAEPGLLTTVRQVHDLGPNSRPTRVHITATVTYYDSAEFSLFVQDATGGVFIETDKRYPVHAGDLISIDGSTTASYFTDVALDPEIRVVAPAVSNKLPTAARVNYAGLVSGKTDCRLATVRGVVRAINVEQHENAPILHLDLNMPGGVIEVYQPIAVMQDGKLPNYQGANGRSLLDTTIDVTGVVGGAFDAKNNLTGVILYAQSASYLRVAKPARTRPEDLPITDIDDVFHSRLIDEFSRRLRLRGVLTYYQHGDAAVLEMNGKSIHVLTRETKPIPIGAVVDALGFASDQEYAPSLRQGELFDTGERGVVVPRPTTYDEAFSGQYSDNLISIEGDLVSEIHAAGQETIVLNVDGHPLRALLEGTQHLRDLRPGTRVRLIGICRIVPGGPWRAPVFVHLQMRGPDDLVVLAAPPWYTVSRLLQLLGWLAVFAGATVAWAMLLRHRVRMQTRRIERTMLVAKHRSHLLEHISSNRPLETVLREICNCVTTLLAGTSCHFHLDREALPPEIVSRAQPTPPVPADNPEEAVLFSIALLDDKEQPVGRLTVVATRARLKLENRYELFAMISEVAHLAMRQALLYQGLLHHSTHDALTNLPNRRLAGLRLRAALDEGERDHTSVVVLYIDVNRFKQVNDEHGHRIGDLYLQAISTRLMAQLRSTDTFARIGGDEFLLVIPHCDIVQGTELRRRLARCFAEPFLLEDIHIHGASSIGLAAYPDHGSTPEDLVRYADHAMYLDKRSSALGHGTRLPEINILTPEELQLALERRQFRVAYQPQFSADGELRGLEALLRLEDSILGTLRPETFLAAAERCDIILQLGLWVLETALRDAMRWRLGTTPSALLVVNVALRQVSQPDFCATVLALLEGTGFPAQRLELELNEHTLLTDNPEVRRQLGQLRAAGVRVSIDDFGLGRSALSLLHRLPLDTIKIDRSFVMGMTTQPDVLPVIRAIAHIAHRLGKRIVAEGLESVDAVPGLLRLGEMDFQGYLLSHPVSTNQMELMLPLWRIGLPMPAVFRETRHTSVIEGQAAATPAQTPAPQG